MWEFAVENRRLDTCEIEEAHIPIFNEPNFCLWLARPPACLATQPTTIGPMKHVYRGCDEQSIQLALTSRGVNYSLLPIACFYSFIPKEDGGRKKVPLTLRLQLRFCISFYHFDLLLKQSVFSCPLPLLFTVFLPTAFCLLPRFLFTFLS